MLSVGIDIGTSTTQLVISKLTIQNISTAFTVPKMAITQKEVLYRSAIHFTPLLSDTVIDTEAIKAIVDREYENSGVDPHCIETGAVIITGETARKENAKQVLSALAGYAGDFVVATAGPDLEGVLAGKGAGCDVYSKEHRKSVLNFDIGGGTSNLCLFTDGECVDTGCFNVGGRLIKLDGEGTITYISPVLNGLTSLTVGQMVTPADVAPTISLLVSVLEQGAGLSPKTHQYTHFITNKDISLPQSPVVFSFSGGCGKLIYDPDPPHWLSFGDIGVLLGSALARSKLLQQELFQPKETIRATVVGAGSHTTTLSGSTISYENMDFPMKNLPVLAFAPHEVFSPPEVFAAIIGKKLQWFWEGDSPSPVVLSFAGTENPSFATVSQLADAITSGASQLLRANIPLLICIREDMAKALGQAILCRISHPRKLLCMDGLDVATGAFLDIGSPVESALPVVIKTLLFTS